MIQESIKQGVKWELALTLADEGTPVDLAGYSVALTVRSNMGEEFTLSSVTDGGIVLLDGSVEDHIQLTLTTAQTSEVNWEHGCGDIELTNPAGEVEESWRIVFKNQLKGCC